MSFALMDDSAHQDPPAGWPEDYPPRPPIDRLDAALYIGIALSVGVAIGAALVGLILLVVAG